MKFISSKFFFAEIAKLYYFVQHMHMHTFGTIFYIFKKWKYEQ